MKVVSWHGGKLSKQTGQKMVDLIGKAEGIIVLPLTQQDINAVKVRAQNREEMERIVAGSHHLSMFGYMAMWAINQGKAVIPLYSKDFFKKAKEVTSADGKSYLSPRTSRQEANAAMTRLTQNVDREQMMYQLDRLRKTKPALIIAPDNQAIVLARLFRVKVTKLTQHSPGARRLAEKSMKNIRAKMREPLEGKLKKPKRRPG